MPARLTRPTTPAAAKAGAPDAEGAQRVGAKTERERDSFAASGAFSKDRKTTGFRARALAFERAMAGVATK